MLRNVGSNWILTIVAAGATYALTPFIIHALGREGYGVWTLITALTGYISLLALGVPMACVRYLAQHIAERDVRQINSAIGSCAGLYLMMSAAAVVLGTLLTGLFLAAYDIPAGLQRDAWVALLIMVVQSAAAFIGFLPEGIMFAHHDFVMRNLVRISGVLLRLSLTIALLMLEASLIVLALVQMVCLAFDVVVSWLLIRRRYTNIRIHLSDFDWAMVRRIFSFSIYALLLNAGVRLTFETDALVIGAALGVGLIPFYTVANSLVVYLMDLVIAIAAVVAPMATKLGTEGNWDELREIFLKWSKVALSVSMMAGLFLIVLGPRFIAWWIDPSFERPSGQVLQIIMASSLLFLPVRGVALPILMGLGNPRTPTFVFLATGLMNLGLSFALARPLGLVGVALGTAIPNVLFAFVVLVLACRQLNVTVSSYLNYVVPRAALGAMPVAALLLWFKVGLDVHTIAGLIAAGSAMIVLFGLLWVFFVYRNDPYVDIRMHLDRFRVWSRA
ncbi:MAG: oligosaccharide flippase family protein [Vicinamibacterales bacterium]